MPRLVNWPARRASSDSPSQRWSAAALPSAAAAVAISTAAEPGLTGVARRTGARPVSVNAMFTARQGIRGASSSISVTQSLPTVAGS